MVVCLLEMINSSIDHCNHHATVLFCCPITIYDQDVVIGLFVQFAFAPNKLGKDDVEPTVALL